MSFYTGKPGGKAICHITKGQHNRTTMAGAPFSETVFHTDVDYLDYKRYSLTKRSVGFGYGCWLYGNDRLTPTTYVGYSTLPSEVITYINAGHAWSLLSNNVIVYTSRPGVFIGCVGEAENQNNTEMFPYAGVLWTNTLDAIYWNDYGVLKNIPAQQPSSTYTIPLYDGNLTNMTFIVWGMTTTGAFKPLTTQPGTTGEVKINKSQFLVNGKDILNIKYLSSVVLNSSDVRISSTNVQFQLINSVTKSSTVEIISNPTKTELKKGGYPIISSLSGSTNIDLSTVYSTYIPEYNSDNNSQSFTVTALLDTPVFAVGQVFMISTSYDYYSDTYFIYYSGSGQAGITFAEFANTTIATLYSRTVTVAAATAYSVVGTLYGSNGRLYYKWVHTKGNGGQLGTAPRFGQTMRIIKLD